MTIEMRSGKSPIIILSEAEVSLRQDSNFYRRKAAELRAKHPEQEGQPRTEHAPYVTDERLAVVYERHAGMVSDISTSLRREEVRAMVPHYKDLSDSQLDEIIRKRGY